MNNEKYRTLLVKILISGNPVQKLYLKNDSQAARNVYVYFT